MKRISPRNNRIFLLAGLSLVFIFFILVIWRIDFKSVIGALAELNPNLLLWPVIITLVRIPLRPLRWWLSFPRSDRPAFSDCFLGMVLGNFSNNILPARGGDILRCFIISNKLSTPKASMAAGTISLEKILDILVMACILAVTITKVEGAPWLIRLAVTAGILSVVVLGLIYLLNRSGERILRLTGRWGARGNLAALAGYLRKLFSSFLEGLSALNSPGKMVVLALISILVWLGEGLTIWTLSLALGVELKIWQAMLLLSVLGLGLTIPSGPSHIGTYEFFSLAALNIFLVDPDQAMALTLLMHAWLIMVTTSLGLVGLMMSQVRLRDLLGLRANPGPEKRPVQA